MRKWKQTTLGAALALGLLHLVAPAAERSEPPPNAVVQKGLLRIAVRLFGVVVPAKEVMIKPRVAGEVVSLPVEMGQMVKKGQKLLEVEATDLARAVARAQTEWLESLARRQMARLRLAVAEREFRTGAPGLREGPTTYALELARQEVALQEAATSRTKIALDCAQAELARTTLLSPMDGVVTECLVRPGEVIAPGAVASGAHLMTVSDFSRISVLAEVDESQVRDIQTNLAANVVLSVFPERRFQGRVASISPRGQVRDGKPLFPIRIDLEGDPGDAARIGLTANVEIVAIEKPDTLLLETRAVRFVGAVPHVLVLDKDKPRDQIVRLGRSDGVRAEVLEGLREGDVVIPPEPPPKR